MKIDDDLDTGPLELPGEPEKTRSQEYKSQLSQPKGKGKKIIILFGVIACLAGIGFLVALITSDRPTEQNQEIAVSSEANPQDEATPTAQDVPGDPITETFTANSPRLSLDHPGSWQATESDSGIILKSPVFSYLTTAGETVQGYFKIFIRQGARDTDSTYIGRGVAALPSEELTYNEPAPGQREKTNLSYFGLDSPDHFAYFFIAGNFSLKIGDTLGPDYGKEPGTYIVAGGYGSEMLEDAMATHSVPLDYFQTTKAYRQAIEIIESLKLL